MMQRVVVVAAAALLVALASMAGRSQGLEHQPYRVARSSNTVVVNATHDYYHLRVYPELETTNKWLQPDDTWTVYRAQRRTYVTVPLSFSFPFYGVKTRYVHVAAGGFVSTSPTEVWPVSVESYYIAPLLADFRSGNSTDETIAFKDMGEAFVVQWRGVVLHTEQTPEPFSFQCALYRDGTIEFFYNEVPLTPNLIRTDATDRHPVEVGLADSYTRSLSLDGQTVIVRYDYHSIDVPKTRIQNATYVVFDPLPTCHSFTTCTSCAHHDTIFDCVWCSAIGRCSDGFDRYRDEFLSEECDTNSIMPDEADKCPEPATRTYVFRFGWPATNFSSECWYWLGVRIDHDVSTFQEERVEQKEDSAGVTVSFALTLTEPQSQDVIDHLSADIPLNCGGTELAVTNVQRRSTGSSSSLSTETIILIACAGVLAMLMVVTMGVLFYGYTNPTSSLGQWMIRHRRCQGLCCGGGEQDADGHGAEAFDNTMDRTALQDMQTENAYATTA